MKTTLQKKQDHKPKWFLVDATDKVLGKVATKIADKLRGKDRPQFSPQIDAGDYVIVINAKKVKLTGKKLTDKKYYSHSRYPGGLKVKTAETLLEKKPTEVIKKAVRGMMPKNRIGRGALGKLHIYAGEEHSHIAQKPTPLEIK